MKCTPTREKVSRGRSATPSAYPEPPDLFAEAIGTRSASVRAGSCFDCAGTATGPGSRTQFLRLAVTLSPTMPPRCFPAGSWATVKPSASHPPGIHHASTTPPSRFHQVHPNAISTQLGNPAHFVRFHRSTSTARGIVKPSKKSFCLHPLGALHHPPNPWGTR
jgi:hypothetical protein